MKVALVLVVAALAGFAAAVVVLVRTIDASWRNSQ